MLDILFGWRKASKCKRLIRRVQCRLKLLKNKRYAIVRQLREDVAQLIKTGYEEIAIDRAEQLYKDESIMAVYELLDHFCEFILSHLRYIRRHKDCPNDINEAISSLVFASARFGDLPELRKIRKLFGERYGDSFTRGALELYSGNLVNSEIREKLSVKLVPIDVKLRMIDEISREYSLLPEILAIEYASELQTQMKEIMEPHVIDPVVEVLPASVEEPKLQVSDAEGIETKSGLTDSKDAGNELEIVPVISSLGVGESLGRASDCKEKVIVSSSPSPSSGDPPDFSRENIVFLDDVEEVRSPLQVNGNSQDQRLFKFKSSPVPRIEIEDGYLEESNSLDGSPDLRFSSKNKTEPENGLRKKPVSRDNQLVESIEFASYYNGPNKKPSSKHRPNQQRIKRRNEDMSSHRSNIPPIPEEKFEPNTRQSETTLGCKAKDCSLEHPCVHNLANGEDTSRANTKHHPVSEVELLVKPLASPLKQATPGAGNVTIVYNIFTYHRKNPRTGTTNKGLEQDVFVSEYDSSCSGEDEQGIQAYLRAMTMPPPRRPREVHSEKISRANTYPFQNPNHVHPKLPDYEDIAAKFSALKKEHMQGQDQCTKQRIR